MPNEESRTTPPEKLHAPEETGSVNTEDISESAYLFFEEESDPAPVYETFSESQLADAIARAVEVSMVRQEPVFEQGPEFLAAFERGIEKREAQSSESGSLEAVEQPEPSAASVPENPEPSEPSAPGASEANEPVTEPADSTPEETPPEPEEEAAPETAPAEEAEPEKPEAEASAAHVGRETIQKKKSPAAVKNPGTNTVKIPKSNLHTESEGPGAFAQLLGGLRELHAAALPKNGTPLKESEKKKNIAARIDHVLDPVRTVILILMFMCIAGRRFEWMTLGFMAGLKGTYVSLMLTLVCFLICWQSTYRGLRDIIYFRFSYETILLIATELTMAEALRNKNPNTLLPLLTMSWCVSGMATLKNTQSELRALRALITSRGAKGVRMAPEKWNKTDLIGQAKASSAGFVRHQAEPDVFHSGYSAYGIPMLAVALILSAYISTRMETSFLTVLVTLIDVGTPVSMVLCCARPYELLTRALSGHGTVAGWFGIKNLSGRKAMMISDSDLFPKGTVGHKGIKVYGRLPVQVMASYAASLICKADMGLNDLFLRFLQETGGQLLEVSEFRIMEGGVQGRIRGSLVQAGTAQFIQLMGIELPEKAPTYGVYMAADGVLEGVFAVKYAVKKGANKAFRALTRDFSLTPLIATRNFSVNPSFIERWFGAPVNHMSCPKADTRRRLSNPITMQGSQICGFVFREGIVSYGRLVSSARRVYRMGLLYTAASVVISLWLFIDTALALLSEQAVVTGPKILLIQMILYAAVEIGARIAARK